MLNRAAKICSSPETFKVFNYEGEPQGDDVEMRDDTTTNASPDQPQSLMQQAQ